jgi:multiple sugar transport system substrate-binding protein
MNNGPQPVQDTQRIVRAFEKQTGVNVKVELVGWDVQFDRIRNAAVSGGGPDVTQAGTTQVPFFAALSGFADLTAAVKDIGGKAAYAPGIWRPRRSTARTGRTRSRGSPRRARSTTARTSWRRRASTRDGVQGLGLARADAARRVKDRSRDHGKPIAPFGSPARRRSTSSTT